MTTNTRAASTYQIKITLDESKPLIWRQIRVPGATSLYKLHNILQLVMGWEDGHLHEFIIGGKKYSHPDAELEDSLDGRKVTLTQLGLSENSIFTYIYDFGDSWGHSLLVEKISPSENTITSNPACLAGQKACPPEDCGGIWGYEEFIVAIKDPKHERHEELLDWVGGVFDPESFDLNAINKALRKLK